MGHTRSLAVSVVFFWLIFILGTCVTSSAARGPDWSFMSPDLDGDGLPNDVETTGWCNAAGCFQTDPLDADSDDDGLTDGEEKLFESNPNDSTSPGIYVVYDNSLKTKEYYPWQQYGSKLIARGDAFDPPNPDPIDIEIGHGTDLNAIVVRRGATFYVGGPAGASLQITKSNASLTSLATSQDPCTGKWRVSVPSSGTVGKYTLTLGNKSLDMFVIFQLPSPSGELTQLGIEKFLYDDDRTKTFDENAIQLVNYRYPGDPNPGYYPPYHIPSGEEIKEGHSYKFATEQYDRYLLEEHVIGAINGKTDQKSAADALVARVDKETVFRNPRGLTRSLRVLYPGSNPRVQCSDVAGLLAAFSRAAGIPARPVMVDWRHGSFDHADELWLNGDWRVYRGYKTLEMASYPDNTHQGCAASVWPACGTYNYYSRSSWGTAVYRPWHSGGNGGGNVIISAGEDWLDQGMAYRWASWDIGRILLDTSKLRTQNAKYWPSYGWTHEPTDYGSPYSWPSPPAASVSSGAGALSAESAGLSSQSSEVQLGDVVAEYGIDLNGNGRYDQLVLEVEVTVPQPGSYWLRGQLSASQPAPALQYSGGVIAEALAHPTLVAGSQVVRLVFGGPEIALSGVNGPYLLSGLQTIAGVENPGPDDFNNNSLAERVDVYSTAAYRAADFDDYGATLSDSYSHQTLDSNGDGHPDALLVTTSINVSQPGKYTVEGTLYDGQDKFIAHAIWTGTGPEVTLRFDKVVGTFGPYALRDVDLLNAEGQSIDYAAEAYIIPPVSALANPDHASFNVLPAGGGLTIQGLTITPTQVFSESLVNGNLQFRAEVQVAQAGSYKIEAWLADAGGNLLTWASGRPAGLPVGTQTLSLTFDGRAIRTHGVNGPYQVVALKVLNGTGNYTVLDKVDIALTTQAYTLSQFTPVGGVLFEDFVESGGSRWTAASPWTISQNESFSPSHAWYGSNADASLTLTAPLNFSNAVATLRLRTCQKLNTSTDKGYVEASTDGSHWDTLAAFTENTPWSTRFLSLSDYANQGAVRLRFRLASAGGANDAWYLDDILVVGLLDSDADGLSDSDETGVYHTDPHNPDTDGDGMPDGWEVNHGLNPLTNDAGADPDHDGLTNLQEYQHHTNPQLADTDGDGMPDGWEVNHGLDPLANDAGADPDNDGLTNLQEYQHGTNPQVADTDGDGLTDGQEVNTYHTNPLVADSDNDGLTDGQEVTIGTDPNQADTDGDGIGDGVEVGPDPSHPLNTDGDAFIDARDTDSDNDVISDATEWDTDQNASHTDDLCANDGLDTDRDGIPNCQDNNADGDVLPNYRDLDSDGDGISDAVEGIGDDDGDGIPNWLDSDPSFNAPLIRLFLPIILK
jgi:hypothetical protein